MTCNVFKPSGETLGEAKLILGMKLGPGEDLLARATKGMSRRQAAQVREQIIREFAADEASPAADPNSVMFMCGPGLHVPVCACGRASDYLCDYPVGHGKTCDLPLCIACRHPIGTDHDFCLIHFAEFKGKAGLRGLK